MTNKKPECAKCNKVVCMSEHSNLGPDNCPTEVKADVIRKAVTEYENPEVKEFSRQAAIQEFECFLNLPQGLTAVKPRVQEVVEFAKKLGYEKLGVAFCSGLRSEARTLIDILEYNGFNIVSVCCKVGGLPKKYIGVRDDQKVRGPKAWESMCNPISQAEILNEEGTDFNIAVGLCVGHDSLFLKHANALTTVLITKDRVFGHNPVAGIYQCDGYYRRLLGKGAR